MDKSAFFDHRNTIHCMSESEKQNTNHLAIFDAISRSTNLSIYVINYLEQGFEYVSENPLFLCGKTPEEVLKMGYDFYFKHVPEEDLKLLLKINDIGFRRYEEIPIEERLLYTISYDFHLITKDNKSILINQKLTPIFLNNKGKVWKALCIISLSSAKKAGNIKVYKEGENNISVYDLKNNVWRNSTLVQLSEREIDILRYAASGFTINEIADKLFITSDTVKFHRKKLFEKMNVSNISEAILFAHHNKLI